MTPGTPPPSQPLFSEMSSPALSPTPPPPPHQALLHQGGRDFSFGGRVPKPGNASMVEGSGSTAASLPRRPKVSASAERRVLLSEPPPRGRSRPDSGPAHPGQALGAGVGRLGEESIVPARPPIPNKPGLIRLSPEVSEAAFSVKSRHLLPALLPGAVSPPRDTPETRCVCSQESGGMLWGPGWGPAMTAS